MGQWHFKLKQPDDTTRDPISGEFFATEAIRNSAEALMREGIQNSLDARPANGTVKICITISGDDWAADNDDARVFLGGLEPHLEAAGNGIREDLRPNLREPARFISFEDFGTTGLIGDPLQWHRVEGRQNGFFAFFRAEGENAKSEDGRRGRWGIGKFVFPRASYGSAFIGWTIREDVDRSLLLGRCILKSHETDAGIHVPDGYFGERRQIAGGQITAPVEDADLVDAFRRTFRLTRTDEPGLSLVVPWYDREISSATVVDAALRDWFFCLLTSELEIEVVAPESVVSLNADTVVAEAERLPQRDRDELLPLMRLTAFAISSAGRQPVVCAPAEQIHSPKWPDRLFEEATLERIRRQLDANEPVAIRVPIEVRPKREPPLASYFDVFLTRDADYESGRPVFVREGIIVSDARGTSARGFRSLVVASHAPMANLLGDAENPAHTEWRPDTGNFKEKYKYGKAFLDYVRESVRNLVRAIEQDAADTAPDLLVDFFSLPEEDIEPRPQKPTPADQKPGDAPLPPVVVPPGRPRRYAVSRVDGGFSVSRGARGAPSPSELHVRVAYDVRAGDPFRKYDPEDFQLLRGGIEAKPAPRGLKILAYEGNGIRFQVTDEDFRLTLIGFDTNRDLVVSVTPHGDQDAASS